MLSMNSLAAADYLLIALQCEYMVLEWAGARSCATWTA